MIAAKKRKRAPSSHAFESAIVAWFATLPPSGSAVNFDEFDRQFSRFFPGSQKVTPTLKRQAS